MGTHHDVCQKDTHTYNRPSTISDSSNLHEITLRILSLLILWQVFRVFVFTLFLFDDKESLLVL